MYDLATRQRALSLVEQGRSLNSVSKETGIFRWALRACQQRIEPSPRARSTCPRCESPQRSPEDTAGYAYLLGLYLGDGCISEFGRACFLRIACADG